MVISDEQLEKFRSIYKAYYGAEIPKDKAYEEAVKLVSLIQLIYQPMTREEFAKYNDPEYALEL